MLTSPAGAAATTTAAQLHCFDFNSEQARMSVVVRLGAAAAAHPDVRSLVKGSPEAIQKLCEPATLPADFERVLAAYAGGGYRVIACAEKRLSLEEAAAAAAGTLSRAAAEQAGALRFLGLVVLENPLKPSSATCSALCGGVQAKGRVRLSSSRPMNPA